MKGWKTYFGIVVTALGLLAAQLNIDTTAQLPEWLAVGIQIVGLVVATYGRYDKERRAPGM